MDSGEPAFALERTELFENLDAGAVNAARSFAVRRDQSAGSTLLRQGEDPTHLYVIEKGRLKMTRVTPDGAQMTVGVLNPGDVVGCVAVFKGMPYPASATAIDDLTVLSWTRATVDRMLKEQPGFAKNALRIVGSRTAQMLSRVQETTSDRVEQRVARALLRLARGGNSGNGTQQTVATTRQDLADLTGSTLYTASRIIAQWQRQGIVESGRKRIKICNDAALRAVAREGAD